ncbi:MAG: helix-turn-helix domain-containing protein [Pseudomonadota bacterium]
MDERLFLRLDGDPVHGPETRLPDDSMRAFEVAPALRGHVASIALYREHIPPGHEVIERVLPDGAVHLVFNLGDAPSANGAPGLALEAVGASSAPAVLRLRGRLEGLSLTLRPGAAAALLGLPAGEISHAAVPLDALWRGEAARLLEQMAAARDDDARAALLQAALQRRLQQADATAHLAAMQAARLIAASAGRRPLREVAQAIGVGERRLQQLFHAHVGLSPRAYGRLARLHACLRALREQPDPAWPELALQAGFYDQSHLVNEFRSLCGLTPTLFLQRTVSGSSKTTG